VIYLRRAKNIYVREPRSTPEFYIDIVNTERSLQEPLSSSVPPFIVYQAI